MILFAGGIGLIILAGAIAGLTGQSRGRDNRFQSVLLFGCGLAAIDPIAVLQSGTSRALTMPSTLPGGSWVIAIDRLSAVFVLTTLVVGAMCAVYGTRLLAGPTVHRGAGFAHACFAALLASIALVVTAAAITPFMIAWEVMAISSYLLIVTEYEHADVRRAGIIYLVATHTATLALFAVFALFTRGTSDWSFAALAHGAPLLPSATVSAIVVLALVGFGFKAGMVPFHFWLPPAHAAAPSHVSALMSGVVIKTGVYGLLRILLMLGGAPAWWGWTVLALGTASGVLGVLWALAQHDIKRLLAYHSVENIGIILMGIGTGVLGVAHDMPAIAAIGFCGAILHTVNHALFKSLLFFGAGAVYASTGTREIDRLGGLARTMPLTWLAFAIGAAAIIGLPPLNGFVSEWLVYQGLNAAGQSPDSLRLAVFGIPALALIGALALACFAKVAGVVFLGSPRSADALDARESPRAMLTAMAVLGGACIAIGVLPLLGVSFVRGAASDLAGIDVEEFSPRVIAGTRGVSLLAVVALGIVTGLWALRWSLLRRRVVRREPTWGCANSFSAPRAQYTASSFAAPLVSMFGRLGGLRVERAHGVVRTHPIDLVLDGVAIPVWRAAQRAAFRLRPIQTGRLHWYLAYVMAALLAVLAYLTIALRST